MLVIIHSMLCGECIAVCPEKLFTEGKYEEVWDETVTEARS